MLDERQSEDLMRPQAMIWYRAAKDFGFPVLVACALGWYIVRADDRAERERASTSATISQLARAVDANTDALRTLVSAFPARQ